MQIKRRGDLESFRITPPMAWQYRNAEPACSSLMGLMNLNYIPQLLLLMDLKFYQPHHRLSHIDRNLDNIF